MDTDSIGDAEATGDVIADAIADMVNVLVAGRRYCPPKYSEDAINELRRRNADDARRKCSDLLGESAHP